MQKALIILLVGLVSGIYAQDNYPKTSSEIYENIQRLNFLGSVLYVAAHPDDENTSLISYFSNKTHARVGYISLTRGDGGQNLIGSEIRELLGLIRTEELLSARRIDGGEQFFSRANDFGYSKQPEETFNFWNKDTVLSDLVYVIRKFKPDVIINRFDHRTAGTTHGHHTASAMLSIEAFDIANNPSVFPEHLNYTSTWQPKRLFMNTGWWFYGSKERFHKAMQRTDFHQINIGEFYPTRGISNTEISALSRSQHKSQGFGIAGTRGSQIEYLEHIKGDWDKHNKSVFEGVDTTWSRVEGGKEIGKILLEVENEFDFRNPSLSLPKLLKAYKLIKNLENQHWKAIKLAEIERIIVDCSGLFLEVSTKEKFGTNGDDLEIHFEAVNRSLPSINLVEISIPSISTSFSYAQELRKNELFVSDKVIKLTDNLRYSTPYWLEKPHSLGMYSVDNQELISEPQTPTEFVAQFKVKIYGETFLFMRDIIHKTTSPSEGEVREPFSIVPPVSIKLENPTLVFADNQSREIVVDLTAYSDNVAGTLKLNVPDNWDITPKSANISLDIKGKRQTVVFTITPPNSYEEGFVRPELRLENGEVYTQQVHLIDYVHIPLKIALMPAQTKVIRLDIKKEGESIGYIIGAGDDVANSLREIGYKVTEFEPREITIEKLQQFDVVVIGIRAYDIDNDLPLYQDVLFDYVKQGGTLVNQYNSLRELTTDKLAPYKLEISNDRVTDEESEVRFLAKDHCVLNKPNKITQKDFDGWVQERGLYFPSKWGKEFTPILGMNDKGEKELQGALLVAEYGEGYFIYTGLSFFRELPAGVSGAYRLFANILSIGK
ncbi:MAG: PIG-L family deacetylase [Brumimicrobium sp.]